MHVGPSERAEATREACDGGDKGATGATIGGDENGSISGSGCALDSMASVEVSILRISISSISPDLSSSYASKMILNLSSGVPLGVHRASRADPRHLFVAYAAADLYTADASRLCAHPVV